MSNLALRDAPVLALPHRATGGTHLGKSGEQIFTTQIHNLYFTAQLTDPKFYMLKGPKGRELEKPV